MLTDAQLISMLAPPDHPVDVVFDSDTRNEIDDQYALIYLLKNSEKLHLRALYAAPFFNDRSASPGDGMEQSYEEQLHLLRMMGREDLLPVTFRGSDRYLPDEKTPVDSPAARDLAARAMAYSPEEPLYVVTIGCITNVASAILLAPEIADRIVVVWLGGNATHIGTCDEFNMMQDIAAARVACRKAPFVQLPCSGVVDRFHFSIVELKSLLSGYGPVCDYLVSITEELARARSDFDHIAYSKVIWDVTAVAWLVNGAKFFNSRITNLHLPTYSNHYEEIPERLMRYVTKVEQVPLATDMVQKLTDGKRFAR